MKDEYLEKMGAKEVEEEEKEEYFEEDEGFENDGDISIGSGFGSDIEDNSRLDSVNDESSDSQANEIPDVNSADDLRATMERKRIEVQDLLLAFKSVKVSGTAEEVENAKSCLKDAQTEFKALRAEVDAL
eukprot:TRINITY_DN28399_c0_g1_i1.p1 TRINITY_DN28399_c0_g1~~TRINITY_DN28399_c0_g1_i1.p1  ORF type:complete len:147 (-),score=47.73 TRINITY_DN28399_c0_g1_i1:101-490(-)